MDPNMHNNMPNRPGPDSLHRAFYILAAILLIFNPNTSATITGDKELLRLIANAYQNNIDKIVSWKGKAQIHDYTTNGAFNNESYDNRTIDHSVEFVYDKAIAAARWNWDVKSDTLKRGPSQSVNPDLYFKNTMIMGSRSYTHGPIFPDPILPDVTPRPSTLVIRSSHDEKPKMLSVDFHPMYYFRLVEDDIVERLMFYYENAENAALSDGSINRNNNIVVFETKAGNSINRFTFDLSLGGNLISYYAEDPITKVEYGFEYQSVKGAFIPKHFAYENTNNRHDPPRIYKREVEFLESALNEPIPRAEFEFEKLGIAPGDTIIDTLMGLEYQYKSLSNPMLDTFLEPAEQVIAHDGNADQFIHTEITNPPKPDELQTTEKTETQKVVSNSFPVNYIYIAIGALLATALLFLLVKALPARKKRHV